MSKIFVSHSSLDKPRFIQNLVDALKADNHDVWFDTESISHGTSIPLAISHGIKTCEIFLLIISNDYNTSNWCQKELWAITSKCIGDPKRRMVIVRVDGAEIESLLGDIRYIEFDSRAGDGREGLKNQVFDAVQQAAHPHQQRIVTNAEEKAKALVSKIVDANRFSTFDRDLLNPLEFSIGSRMSLANEGLILVKPGGTFVRPCLEELLRRICGKCEVRQIRVLDGKAVKKRRLFDRHYVTPTRIAKGEISLKPEDWEAIRTIYGVDDFEGSYGCKYSDTLVKPALLLQEAPYNMAPQAISELWERGRDLALFWNRRWNGLNKIGFQKTVFPVAGDQYFKEDRVCIMLNGFVPGYKDLLESDGAITIALHVCTDYPWAEIRDQLVGGKSNPAECPDGSIRKDAYLKRIPLDNAFLTSFQGRAPEDTPVNGQRNVCHSSATLFDGMRELVIWFDYPIQGTLLGRMLIQHGVQEKEIEEAIISDLPSISWGDRNKTFDRILHDVRRQIMLDDLLGADAKRLAAVKRYAAQANTVPDALHNLDDLMNFIENGLRLEISGEEFYLGSLIDKLVSDDEQLGVFLQIADLIRDKVKPNEPARFEILAEAYRIAASDLAFLQCQVYQGGRTPAVFKNLVCGDLSRESLDCARRTQDNLIKSISAFARSDKKPQPTMMKAVPEWSAFVSRLRQPESVRDALDVICLVLAGGRSTRMSSTIPKPVLPFGSSLMLESVLMNLREAVGDKLGRFYAAVGFRSELVRMALGNKVEYLEYPETKHGLGFRVATCLESLARMGADKRLVVLTYTDMPLVSPAKIRELMDAVTRENQFGLLTSHNNQLSGHVVKNNKAAITGVIQQRLHPTQCLPNLIRDVGLYAFHNTPEFRAALGDVKNDNVRKEFIFADVVAILAKNRWEIVSKEEQHALCQSINTAANLLNLASEAYDSHATMAKVRNAIGRYYGLSIPQDMDFATLRAKVRCHQGPFYFFDWWERIWSA
jgi:CTP:molybdopterin cytidylyltransferase MocA